MEHIQHCRQSLCRSLLLLQCGASSFWLGLYNSSFTLRFWLIMKQNVISILHWVDHVPLCAAVTKAVGSWGGHGRLSAAETAVSYGAHTSLSAGMPTTFMATSRVLKDRARRDAARPCLPGATLALLRWAPLPTHVFPGKLGKGRAQREVLKRNGFHLCWCAREMMKLLR